MKIYITLILLTLTLSILFTPDLKAEWRFEFFLGKASTGKSDLNIKQPAQQNDLRFHQVEYNDRSFHTPLYYSLRTSYFVDAFPNWGLEVEFIQAKIYSKFEQMVFVSGIKEGEPLDSIIRFGDMVQDFSMSHGLNFLFFNVAGRFTLIKNKNDKPDKLRLYGRAGIGPSIPHVESTIDKKTRAQFELHGPAYQLGTGVEMNIWKRLGLLLEYKYTFVKVKDAKITGGHASTDLKTDHWVFGLSKAF